MSHQSLIASSPKRDPGNDSFEMLLLGLNSVDRQCLGRQVRPDATSDVDNLTDKRSASTKPKHIRVMEVDVQCRLDGPCAGDDSARLEDAFDC